MKRSKRQENSIIIYFGFYLVLVIALIIFFFSYLHPQITNISELKEKVKTTYSEKVKIEKEGLTFANFKSLMSGNNVNSYQREIITNIDNEFYNDIFKNNTDKSYGEFLLGKKNEFNDPEKNKTFLEKEKEIINLLPIYSEVDVPGVEETMSDFKFINYIENLLATFNLTYSNDIGVTSLSIVEEFSEKEKKSQLDTDLYYIPLTLNLEGTKFNIINFLYFIENVGNITITENTVNILEQDKDKFLTLGGSRSGTKILFKNAEGNVNIQDYNIFENQVISIESLEFKQYLDDQERNRVTGVQTFADFIKETQRNDRIEINVELHFYVKGVQNIKIINQLDNYINFFQLTQQLVLKEVSNNNLSPTNQIRAENARDILKEMNTEIRNITLAKSKQENLNKALKDVSDYNQILYEIHKEIGYDIYVKDFLNKYKGILASSKGELNEYLESIDEEVSLLMQGEEESDVDFVSRINNKKIFERIIQINQNIELKK